jgi:hypothetical protein
MVHRSLDPKDVDSEDIRGEAFRVRKENEIKQYGDLRLGERVDAGEVGRDGESLIDETANRQKEFSNGNLSADSRVRKAEIRFCAPDLLDRTCQRTQRAYCPQGTQSAKFKARKVLSA